MDNMASQTLMSTHTLEELVLSNVLLDSRMSIIHEKIKLKKQKIDEVERETMMVRENNDKLIVEIKETEEAQEKANKLIHVLHQSRIQEYTCLNNLTKKLEIAKEKNKQTFSEREKILEKYIEIHERYERTYKSLSWNQEKNNIQLKMKANSIKLAEVKRDLTDHRRKASTLTSITELILLNKIVAFAHLMVSRKKYSADIDAQTYINKKLEEEIDKLSNREEPKYNKLAKKGAIIPEKYNFGSIRERLGILKPQI